MGQIDNTAMFKLTYGLFVLTTKDKEKDNGCIVNTVSMLTSTPTRICVYVNKSNYSEELIRKTRKFNVSVLTESAPFELFKRFGFSSGRDTDKFEGTSYPRSENGLLYLNEHSNAVISCTVDSYFDYGTHTLFVGEVESAATLSNEKSVTYEYYFANIKPKPQPKVEATEKKQYVCKICGYVHDGELPDDFVCPICKHGAVDFEEVK